MRQVIQAMTQRTMLAVLAALLLSLTPLRQAASCASVSVEGAPVLVEGEEAVIVYDGKTRTEHFIRQARFQTGDPDFGFLVPTPTRPKLATVDLALFDTLHRAMRPERVERMQRAFSDSNDAIPTASVVTTKSLNPLSVTVERAVRVGDLDAIILRASNVAALTAWLKRHHYRTTPELSEWLAPYVWRGWSITAFRVARDVADRLRAEANDPFVPVQNKTISLQPVRLSFPTLHAFYPYRESSDAVKNDTRLLRVFYLGSARVSGKLGMDGATAATPWPARTVQSRALSADRRRELARTIGIPPQVVGERLTVLEDHVPLRARADLYLLAASDQSVLRPVSYVPRYIRVPFPAWVALAGGFALLLGSIAGIGRAVVGATGYLRTKRG